LADGVERFFVVGAQRCGTTYLHGVLDAHPEIEMAKPVWPEPKFFIGSSFAEQGVDYYERHFFDPGSTARLKGEKSTSYIEYELAARRIAETYPRSVVVMVFRDPVERAISNYWFSVRNGVETLSMEQAFSTEKERLNDYDGERFSASPFAYLKRGHYARYFRLWNRYFERDQIKMLIFERLVADRTYLRTVYQALRVDPSFVPPNAEDRVNAADGVGNGITPELREFLGDHFRDSIAELCEVIGDRLEEWNAERR
jgi:Sulfotransferase domain